MEKVEQLLQEIKAGGSTKASQKDELRVMRSMLNDKDYKVGVYNKEGLQGTFCPAEEIRAFASSVIKSTTKISEDEAVRLAEEHEFSKGESQNVINVSKEFVNTYLQTGKRLPLGGREKSDAALILEEKAAGPVSYNQKVGVTEDDKPIIERRTKEVPAYDKVKSSSTCPTWVK